MFKKRNKKKISHSAGFILFRIEQGNIKYLLLQTSKDYWNFPKGHVESGENSLQAAFRELQEETGIVNPRHIKGFESGYDWHFYVRENNQKQRIDRHLTLFVAQVFDDAVTLSDEHISYGWFSYQDALKKIKFRVGQKNLEQAHRFLLKRPKL